MKQGSHADGRFVSAVVFVLLSPTDSRKQTKSRKKRESSPGKSCFTVSPVHPEQLDTRYDACGPEHFSWRSSIYLLALGRRFCVLVKLNTKRFRITVIALVTSRLLSSPVHFVRWMMPTCLQTVANYSPSS